MKIELQQQLKRDGLISLDKTDLKHTPILLFLISSACVILTISVSTLPGWNVIVHIIAFLFVLTHVFFILSRRVKFVFPNAVHIIFLTWSILGIIGGYNTVYLSVLFGKMLTVLQLIILSYFLYALAIHMRSIIWLEWSCLLGILISTMYVFLTNGGNLGAERISGLQNNSNYFALILLLSIVISLHLFKRYNGIIIKSFLIFNIGIAFYLLLAAGSRKGLIGFFLILCFEIGYNLFFSEKGKRIKSMFFGVFVIVLVLMVCVPMFVASPFFYRFQNLERYVTGKHLVNQERSIQGRHGLANIGIKIAIDNPIFGVGHDQLRSFTGGSYAHSNVIEVLANTGFLGFFVYYSAWMVIAFRLILAWKIRIFNLAKIYLYLVMMIGLVILVYELFSVTYYDKVYWIILSIVLYSTEFIRGQVTQMGVCASTRSKA